MKRSLIVFCFFAVYACFANAGLLFNYHQLALKDLDQMNAMIKSKIKEAKKEGEAGKIVPLKEALQAVYSRPNDDGMIEKVVGPLRSQMEELDIWNTAISQLVTEAINSLTNPKAFKPDVQVTYALFLTNYLSEVKPNLSDSMVDQKTVEKIAKANIEFTKEALNERRLRMLKETASPSQIASKLMQSLSTNEVAPPEKAAH